MKFAISFFLNFENRSYIEITFKNFLIFLTLRLSFQNFKDLLINFNNSKTFSNTVENS